MSDFDVIIVGGGIAGAGLGVEVAAKRRTLILEAEDQCGYHTTGRSAAFWLAHYGGPRIVPLTIASKALLEGGWPTGGRSLIRRRGIVTIARHYMELREALAANSVHAPLFELDRSGLERHIPNLKEGWDFGVWDPSCADIEAGELHANCLAQFRRNGGSLLCGAPLHSARRTSIGWEVKAGGEAITTKTIVNAAGAWADEVARRCAVPPLGVTPYRRTVVQLRIGRTGLKDLPLVNDALERFYFKGESDNRVWISPHDMTESEPCDAAPEEIDVAQAIDHFQSVVDWPIEAVERKWAGLRSFTPHRVPAYGFDSEAFDYFWCVGQGGFGIQTSAAASKLAAGLLLKDDSDPAVSGIDADAYSPRQFKR